MTTLDNFEFEKAIWECGVSNIAGVDEVGRGCLFGDVVAAAVILPPGMIVTGVTDSKKLSAKKREALYDVIVREATAWAVARIDAQTIDRINIKQATRLAMKQAVEQLVVPPEHVLIDAEQIELSIPQSSIIKGDLRSQSIAAASIVAKVTRDRLCEGEWEDRYPGYGIAGHKGYGTVVHVDAIRRMGVTEMHRQTFLNNILHRE